jgi:signal transduction histidine kinase
MDNYGRIKFKGIKTMNHFTGAQTKKTIPLGEIYGDVGHIQKIFYWFITLVLAGLIAGALIVHTTRNEFAFMLTLAGVLPGLVSYYLVYRRKFEFVAIFLSVILILLTTFVSTRGLGIHHISVLAFPGILIVASLVTRKRTMIFLTSLTILCLAWLVFGEIYGLYTPGLSIRSAPGDFYLAALIIVLTAVMVRVLNETLSQNYMQLQKELAEREMAERQAEALIRELELKNAESETLRESLASVVSTIEFTEIIQQILEQLRRVIPYDSASVWRVEGNVQRFISGRDLPQMFFDSNIEFITDETNSALPILRGEAPFILSNNVQEELEDFKQEPHSYINSWLAIPLKTRGKIIGIIALDGKEKGQFNERHAELAVAFANQVAIALENSQLVNDLQNELQLREELIRELERKNAELERFTYTVSHDLKSPLVTINGFLGYLEADVASNDMERFKHDCRRIKDAVVKMHALLGELLELSRVGRIVNPSQMIPFEDIVRDAMELVHGQLAAGGVAVILQPNLPAVYGDRQRLTEVLQNLIDNAAKFMGDQPDPRIEIGYDGEENGFPIFFVRDNGVGIPLELQERIFGLFDKLDPSSEGSGVGLAIVKRIIEIHGGRIWVQSAPSPKGEAGKGSTFLFTLPKEESQSQS